jgi:hypothetical protein
MIYHIIRNLRKRRKKKKKERCRKNMKRKKEIRKGGDTQLKQALQAKASIKDEKVLYSQFF